MRKINFKSNSKLYAYNYNTAHYTYKIYSSFFIYIYKYLINMIHTSSMLFFLSPAKDIFWRVRLFFFLLSVIKGQIFFVSIVVCIYFHFFDIILIMKKKLKTIIKLNDNLMSLLICIDK